MNAVAAIAWFELCEALRNRWFMLALGCLGGLALLLALVGSTPAGSVSAAPLAVGVASVSSLGVYIIPLLALMLSFDTLVGEAERGTLTLLLTYPVARWQVIAGKFIGHSMTLGAAVIVGYGGAAALVAWRAGNLDGWQAYAQMMGASLLLGTAFAALGYLISAVARERAAAVAAALGAWLAFVVLYDLALLGALALDERQLISERLFGALMLANPVDAYRIFTLSSVNAVGSVTGMAGLAEGAALHTSTLIGSLLAWTAGPLLAASFIFGKREM